MSADRCDLCGTKAVSVLYDGLWYCEPCWTAPCKCGAELIGDWDLGYDCPTCTKDPIFIALRDAVPAPPMVGRDSEARAA